MCIELPFTTKYVNDQNVWFCSEHNRQIVSNVKPALMAPIVFKIICLNAHVFLYPFVRVNNNLSCVENSPNETSAICACFYEGY